MSSYLGNSCINYDRIGSEQMKESFIKRHKSISIHDSRLDYFKA